PPRSYRRRSRRDLSRLAPRASQAASGSEHRAAGLMRPIAPALALTLGVLGCRGPATPVRTDAPRAPLLAVAAPTGPVAPTRADVRERDGPLGEALERLRRRAGWNLVVEPAAAQRRVSLRVFDLPWRDALDLLLERTGCEVAPAGERTLFVSYAPRVTI